MGIVLLAGAIGLTQFAVEVARAGRELDQPEMENAAESEEYETLRVWLPETLIELARSPCRVEVTWTHGGLRGFLEARGREDIWYAYAVRGYQRDGKYTDSIYVRHPYHDAFHLEELRDLLIEAFNGAPASETAVLDNASFGVIPEELLSQEWYPALSWLRRELYHSPRFSDGTSPSPVTTAQRR